ncbi:MAG TPA: hypothetical protein DEA96_07240 [Leptospiraceae bacterium]|nr:hypothetical protein [Spirochaetaceae bacterium]HBS04740.1 hypothetical protein [Leptospiraceae bacterium]
MHDVSGKAELSVSSSESSQTPLRKAADAPVITRGAAPVLGMQSRAAAPVIGLQARAGFSFQLLR